MTAGGHGFGGPTLIAARADGDITVVPPNGSVLVVDPATGERSTAVKPRESDPTAGDRKQHGTEWYQRAVGGQGGLAAVTAADGRVDVHELPSGRRLHELVTGASSVDRLFLSEETRTLFAVVDGDALERWDLATGKRSWRSDGAGEWGIAADPSGRWVATMAGDGTVWLWNARTGDRLGTIVIPTPSTVVGVAQSGQQTSLAFSPDGEKLWSVTEGGELLSWDTSPDAWIERLCDRVGRTLTEPERSRYLTSLSDGITACGS
ncbi:WD40 repeat domain-containing protein [Streptomyces poonensis]|uniref:WD40 repeat domain-containing protein n=1 Tax=Streptomyces poonensis TaxID=68255 RepID=A0A918PBI4_9ACTN|nr:PQQ-binding-like beta-propeller repeat protein [Streptomyces poonensis]GGY94443.1 hypothetical protein GCM10010365_11420 [Streptomyces poonensis]GLJ87417.1 hypothetical protein GCM10017589_00170 [Streptomyces poonensis]